MHDLPVTVNLDAYHGDSWTQTFRFLDGTIPHDLSTATLKAAARDDTGALTQLTVESDAPGEVTISGELEAGTYEYDVQVTESDGTFTWVRGRLIVKQDVTV